MTEREAIELLKHHSFTHDEIDNPKSERGFLGMLRPYQGVLYEDNFHELMSVLTTLKGHFGKDKIDRQIISNFWGICHLSRSWGLEQDGMLRRNNIIPDSQIELLSNWIECISNTIMMLLEGVSDEEAFEAYSLYKETHNDNKMDE